MQAQQFEVNVTLLVRVTVVKYERDNPVLEIGTNLLISLPHPNQGCQMVYFKTKKPNLGIFWKALEWKMSVYFTAVWYHF
jgi:hypothetical protein